MSSSENEIDSNSQEEKFENEEEEDEENEEEENENKNKRKFKKNNKNKLNSSSDSEAEIFQKNLSENEEDNNLYKDYEPPEDEINIFENNISNIKENVSNLNEKLVNLINNLNDNNIQFKYGLSFFDAKNNLFLMYLIELLLYINYKLNPNESIKNSDLLKQLIINKTLIEKLKVIDMKIKNQVDRLINISEDSKNNNIESNYKPRLLDEEEEESLDEEDKEEKKNKEKEKIKYQVNKKLVDFFETKDEKKNRIRQIENDKQRIRNSEYLNVLREEMSDKPRVIESYNKNTNKFMKEIENYEDEHFTNIRIPKKIKKIIKKKESKIDDLNYFDKEIKQMSNILLNDNSKEEENREKKIKFLQRKREINELNKKFNKQKNIKKKK